jgi:predicted hydrocarbon binding protein
MGLTASEMLRAFGALEIGTLQLVSASSERYAFRSGDLHSVRGRARQATCDLALGFLEGVVAASSGRTAMGNEVACRARGDAECRFVVRATP